MSSQLKVRSVGVASLVMFCIAVGNVRAQAPTPARPKAAETAASSKEVVNTAPVQALDTTQDIWDLLNSVSDRVDTAITRATDARDRATEARDQAGEMVTNMNDGLQNLTGEMRSRIQDAVDALQQATLDELAGATDFTNGPNSCSAECENFRSDIVTLLTSIQDISNALLNIAGISGQADLSNEVSFLQSLSGKALYPLYRVFQTLPILNDDFLTSMSEIAGNLEEIAPYLNDTIMAGGQPVDVCEFLSQNDTQVEHIILVAKNIEKVGKGSQMAGAVVDAVGKSKFAARVGIWGWAGFSYTSGLLERIGEHLESMGNRLEPIAEKVERKLQYCVLKVNQEEIAGAVDTNHEQVVESQQAILDAVHSLQAAQNNSADFNGDGIVDLADYAKFQNLFGSTSP